MKLDVIELVLLIKGLDNLLHTYPIGEYSSEGDINYRLRRKLYEALEFEKLKESYLND